MSVFEMPRPAVTYQVVDLMLMLASSVSTPSVLKTGRHVEPPLNRIQSPSFSSALEEGEMVDILSTRSSSLSAKV